jgi:hypothetical protein
LRRELNCEFGGRADEVAEKVVGNATSSPERR